ncbi:hypothetical protein HII31_12449 [Pseudocercospora fuligena]|uniref:Zinc finger PHD-type domain-containing protein n=1 Tax=Pseudocercospora fuligena TaxID=685502 RepID=A0A8H6VD48_9PEZI|nr:hypothetical protein HII31_12449 [Pseudocercospora fuligena]
MAQDQNGSATFEKPVIRRHRTPANMIMTGRANARRASTSRRSSLKSPLKPEHLNDPGFADLAAGKRGFPCPLAVYGCSSTFGSKNEWKRHVYTQHMRLGFWRCDRCSKDNPDRKPNDFNRKDLFIQHVRRMHQAAQPSPANGKEKSAKAGDLDEAFLQNEANRCYRHLRSPPENSRCLFCEQQFHGHGSWEDRMEHVGRHMERARKENIELHPEQWNRDENAEIWFVRESVLEQIGQRLVLADGASSSLPRSPATQDSQPRQHLPIAPNVPRPPETPIENGGQNFAPINRLAPVNTGIESPSRFPSFSGLPMGDTQQYTPQQLAQERKADRTMREKALFRPEVEGRQQEAAVYGLRNRQVPEPSSRDEVEKRRSHLEELADGGVSWYFDCRCGLRGDNIDDGHPSIACEGCDTWQHAKCLDIPADKVQQDDFVFICADCKGKGVDEATILRKLNGHAPAQQEDTEMPDATDGDHPRSGAGTQDPLGAMVGMLLDKVEDLEKRTEPLARTSSPATFSTRSSIRRSHSTPASPDQALKSRGTPTTATSIGSAPAEVHHFGFRDQSGRPIASRAREDPELRAIIDGGSEADATTESRPRRNSEPVVPMERRPWQDSVSVRSVVKERPTSSGTNLAEHKVNGYVHKRKAPQEPPPTIEVVRDFGRPPPEKRPRSAVAEDPPHMTEFAARVQAPVGYYQGINTEQQHHSGYMGRPILPLPSPGQEAPRPQQHQAAPAQHAIQVDVQPRFIQVDHAFLSEVQKLRDEVNYLRHHLDQAQQRERQATQFGGRQYYDCSRPCVFQCVYHGTQIHGDLGCTMRQQGGIPQYPSGPGAATAYAMPSEQEQQQHTQQHAQQHNQQQGPQHAQQRR